MNQEQFNNCIVLVAALRSGTYTQYIGVLRSKHGYCCLGVAEDLRGVEWQLDDSIKTLDNYGFYDGKCTQVAYLSPQGVEHYGFEHSQGFHVEGWYKQIGEDPRPMQYTLAELNDGGLSFSQIADVIEWWARWKFGASQ